MSLWDNLPKEIKEEIYFFRWKTDIKMVNMEYKTYFRPDRFDDTVYITMQRSWSNINWRRIYDYSPWNYIWDIFSYKITKNGIVYRKNPFGRWEIPPNYRHEPIYYDEPLGQFTKRNTR